MKLTASARFRRLVAVAVLAGPLAAHEFWLQPEKFSVALGATVNVSLQRGEDFTGEVRPINTERVIALRHYSAGGVINALPRVPAPPGVESLPFTFKQPGIHLLCEDSVISTITLSPDKFLSYLNDDGLEFVATARKTAQQDTLPGRERYLRCVKTLICVGDKSDATYATRTGQRLEIVPQSDPLAARPGGRLAFTVFFDGQPLKGALVRAWHHREKNLLVVKGRTTADGAIAFEFPYAGPWMISLVHMIPLKDVPDYDWQSYWGNLTFSLRSP